MADTSLAGLAARMLVLNRELKQAEQDILEKGARMIRAEARAAIGTYTYNWERLKPETVARKRSGDSPLLETGELRDSISYTVGIGEAHVGSNNDKAVWHELGTLRTPPRPFLMAAAIRQERKIQRMARRRVRAAFHGAHEFGHVLHIAKEAFENVKEKVQEFKDEGE